MAENKFKIGDVVRLRSGGPNMTIENVGVGISGDEVSCVWFEGTKRKSDTFPPDALQSVEPRPRVTHIATGKGM